MRLAAEICCTSQIEVLRFRRRCAEALRASVNAHEYSGCALKTGRSPEFFKRKARKARGLPHIRRQSRVFGGLLQRGLPAEIRPVVLRLSSCGDSKARFNGFGPLKFFVRFSPANHKTNTAPV